MWWFGPSVVAFGLLLTSCGATGGKRAAIRAQLYWFNDVQEHLDQHIIEGRQAIEKDHEALNRAAIAISHYGDPATRADVEADQLVGRTVDDLQFIMTAMDLSDDPAGDKELSKDMIKRNREDFAQGVAKLDRMAQ